MRIAALLAWFDEPEAFLVRAIESAAAAGVGSLVAADGRYELYESERVLSPGEQVGAIRRAARSCGLDLTLVLPGRPWRTEIEKRTALFRFGDALAADWFLILDSDYELHQPLDLRSALAGIEEDAGELRMLTPTGPGGSARYGSPPDGPMRCLFRALPGIEVVGNHYTYVAQDGRRLWGNYGAGPIVPAATIEGTLTHWTYHRSKARVSRQFDYYRARDAAGIERAFCTLCGERISELLVLCDPRDLGAGDFEAGWREICAACEPTALRSVERQAVEAGLDPARMRQRITLGEVAA